MSRKDRFGIIEFENPSGAMVFRVTGRMSDGRQVRQNFKSYAEALARKGELEVEALGVPVGTSISTLTPVLQGLGLTPPALPTVDSEVAVWRDLVSKVESRIQAARQIGGSWCACTMTNWGLLAQADCAVGCAQTGGHLAEHFPTAGQAGQRFAAVLGILVALGSGAVVSP